MQPTQFRKRNKRPKWTFNPFLHLTETAKSFSTRILRSSFRMRIVDTFLVFYGNIGSVLLPNQSSNARMGLLDFIFPIPRLFQYLSNITLKLPIHHYMQEALFVASLLPRLALIAMKFITASVLTAISLPLVGLVHLFITPQKNKLINAIKKTYITLIKKDNLNTPKKYSIKSSKFNH
jgi:hypothetical protein